MSERGVDLLGDDLVKVERQERAPDAWFGPVPLPATPESPPEGVCELCKERASQHRCVHCRRAVCGSDFWTMLGLCKSCATEKEMAAAREGTRRPRPDLDIKWIED